MWKETDVDRKQLWKAQGARLYEKGVNTNVERKQMWKENGTRKDKKCGKTFVTQEKCNQKIDFHCTYVLLLFFYNLILHHL